MWMRGELAFAVPTLCCRVDSMDLMISASNWNTEQTMWKRNQGTEDLFAHACTCHPEID